MLRVVVAFICIIIASSMLIVGFNAQKDARRLFSQNVVYIAPLYDDTTLFFSAAYVERLRTNFPQYEISHLSSGSAMIHSQINQARASVVFTSHGYYNAHFLYFREGAPPMDFSNAVLLSELLAWRLFGGFNVVGVIVWIHGEPFVVSGVVKGDNMGYTAWLPQSADRAMQITSLIVRFPYYNAVTSRVVPREMLGGRNLAEYMILDINRFVEAINLRNRLILYFVWLVLLTWVLGKSYRFYRSSLQEDVINKNVNEFRLKNTTGSIRKFVVLSFAAGFAFLSVYVIFTGAIDILIALPNFALADESFMNYLFGLVYLPPEKFLSPNMQHLIELNIRANIAFLGAFCAIIILCATQAAKAGPSCESAGLPPLR